jgi:hypothetical protein
MTPICTIRALSANSRQRALQPLQGFDFLCALRNFRPIGRALVRPVSVMACFMILLRLTAITFHAQIKSAWPRGDLHRAAIGEQLQRLTGRQLAEVSYDWVLAWPAYGKSLDRAVAADRPDVRRPMRMLQAWLPPPWALLGAALAVLRLGILSCWMNTYWYASIAAFGGALVRGAWPRLCKHLRVRDALLMGSAWQF